MYCSCTQVIQELKATLMVSGPTSLTVVQVQLLCGPLPRSCLQTWPHSGVPCSLASAGYSRIHSFRMSLLRRRSQVPCPHLMVRYQRFVSLLGQDRVLPAVLLTDGVCGDTAMTEDLKLLRDVSSGEHPDNGIPLVLLWVCRPF